jgi:type VI secretion system protein ImpJ
LNDPKLFQHAFFLAVSGSYPEASVREHVPKLTKIAAVAKIGALIHSHVNGARLAVEHRPPGALPSRPGVVFFRLETSGEFWTQMVTSGGIAIYLPFELASMQIALFAVDPSSVS